MLNDAMIAFKEPPAGDHQRPRRDDRLMVALYTEIEKNTSLFHQVINTCTFTPADGVVKSSTFPAPACSSSGHRALRARRLPGARAPRQRGVWPEKAPKDFGPLGGAEMTNGRGAMVGLVALGREVHQRRPRRVEEEAGKP